MDRHTALGKEGILSLIIRFSIPSVVGFTVNAIYNIIDRIFVGRGVGSDALSGVAVAMPFMLTITAFSLFISVGMAVRISIKIGEGKTEEAERIIGNGFILGIIAGLILTAVCTIFMRPILIAFGGKGVSLEYAGKFMDIMVFSIVFQMISYTLSSSIRAEGNPNISLAIMVAGAVINTILNPIFIFVLRLGIAGSALATVISLFAGAVWGILYFTGKNNIIRLRIKNLRPDPKIIFSILSAGSGVFFFHCTQSIMIIVSNNIFSRYGGNDAIAVFGIVCVVNNLFIEVVAGISDGIQPIIGYNYGAGNSGRVKATLLRSIIISSVFCLMGFIPLFFFSRDIISMFSRDNSSIRELGTWGLKYSMIALPLAGFEIIGISYFQAVGKFARLLVLYTLRQLILIIPLLIILSSFFGFKGGVAAFPIVDIIMTLITAVFILAEWKNLGIPAQPNQFIIRIP